MTLKYWKLQWLGWNILRGRLLCLLGCFIFRYNIQMLRFIFGCLVPVEVTYSGYHINEPAQEYTPLAPMDSSCLHYVDPRPEGKYIHRNIEIQVNNLWESVAWTMYTLPTLYAICMMKPASVGQNVQFSNIAPVRLFCLTSSWWYVVYWKPALLVRTENNKDNKVKIQHNLTIMLLLYWNTRWLCIAVERHMPRTHNRGSDVLKIEKLENQVYAVFGRHRYSIDPEDKFDASNCECKNSFKSPYALDLLPHTT